MRHPHMTSDVTPPKLYTLSHQMFGYMHVVLNVDQKIINYTDYVYFARRIFLSLIRPWLDNVVLQ
jgi:hypothetical protein